MLTSFWGFWGAQGEATSTSLAAQDGAQSVHHKLLSRGVSVPLTSGSSHRNANITSVALHNVRLGGQTAAVTADIHVGVPGGRQDAGEDKAEVIRAGAVIVGNGTEVDVEEDTGGAGLA